METSKIRMISAAIFALSMAGIVALRISYKIPSMGADMIGREMIGKDVVAYGVVTYYRPYNGKATFIRLNSLPVVFFSNISTRKGNIIKVYGKVSEYGGKVELIGKRIVG